MDAQTVERIARTWLQRPPGARLNPTQYQLRQLRLPVSDARFDRAMAMAARDMGGSYVPVAGTIKLPKIGLPGDRSYPTELQVLYRKFPCGAMIRNVQPEDPLASKPCVSFDVIPNTPGDPRRSKIYKSLMGEADKSKTLFGKFLGWLKVVSKAVNRYAKNQEQGRDTPFARVGFEQDLVDSVVRRWFEQKMR